MSARVARVVHIQDARAIEYPKLSVEINWPTAEDEREVQEGKLFLLKGQIDRYPKGQAATLQDEKRGLVGIDYCYQNQRHNWAHHQAIETVDTAQLYEPEEERRNNPAQVDQKQCNLQAER